MKASQRRGRAGVEVDKVGPILDLRFPDGNGLFEIEAHDLASLLADTTNLLRVFKLRHVDLSGDVTPLLKALQAATHS